MKRVIILATLSAPAIAAAEPILDGRVDVSIAAGGHMFSKNVELGVDDHMDEPGPSSSGLLGGRVAVSVIKRLAAEAEAVFVPTEDDVLGDRATVIGLRGQARFDLLTGKLRPFVVAGYGVHLLRGGSPQMDNDEDQAYHWGAGVRYAIGRRLDLRVDFRHLIVPDRTSAGATSDFEASAGVAWRFGGTAPVRQAPLPAPAPAPVVLPPKPGDLDGDAILDDTDACRELAEDADQFEDQDGCPDPDNDRDTLLDADDRCPLQAETPNGWQDRDGCPDAVIAELTGIQFERDSAKIDGDSTALLERAYEILSGNPALRVEISGHTSNDGNADRNLDLSLKRAEAVKTYLVRRGISDERVFTVGHGSEKPVAKNDSEANRAKNRRIEFRILTADEGF
jgi:outer membrane protein OmpA-like peptidoglycan-associated protein